MAEPVSWLMIEKPWDVVGSDGEELGTIEEVVGDSSHDIFNGLVVGAGLLHRPRYVPAELVSEIVGVPVTECCDRTDGARCRFEVRAS